MIEAVQPACQCGSDPSGFCRQEAAGECSVLFLIQPGEVMASNALHDMPALWGGPCSFPEGPPSWPLEDEDIRAALQTAYADGSWGRYEGPHGRRLVSLLSQQHGVEHVLPCCSGTFAVELALRGLGIAPGDEVVLAGYDFSGNFRSIEAIGARPVIIDIGAANWCLDTRQLKTVIGEKTRAIVVSHLHGTAAPMALLEDLARRHGLLVVEDACQAPGAIVDRRVAGSWGDVGVLSFGGSKLLTAGRGGAILTRRADVYQRAKVFCERGNQAFPLSELQAAVLIPQLEKLQQNNQRRERGADRLRQAAGQIPGLRPLADAGGDDCPAYYKFGWLYDPCCCGNYTRQQFIAAMQAEGVAIDAGFRGFTRRSVRRCRRAESLPYSQQAAESTVLLHHPILLESQATIDRLAASLKKVIDYFISYPSGSHENSTDQ